MTEKQKINLQKILFALPDDYREAYREVAEYAMSLGYNPKLNPGETYADFVKSKNRRTVMKIDTNGQPRLAVRFDALPVCTGIFEEAVEHRRKPCITREYNHCARCEGTWGSKYTLPDGKEYVICSTVIDIPAFSVSNISADSISAVKEALKVQDDYLMSLITA
ncbi:MAG: hypothetical protein LBI19_01165 [Oscillospiraceae bacterium]|jgi:hypothetical protein|nr:hypothetical protein [Oscillospiraceae bacterium]